MELREQHVIYYGKDPIETRIDDMGGYPLAYERGWDECTRRRLAFARNGDNVRTGRREGSRVTLRSKWVSGGVGSCGSFFLNACFLSTLGSKAIN